MRGRFRWAQTTKLTLANFCSITLRRSAEGRASKGDGGTAVQPPPFEARALRGHLRVTARKHVSSSVLAAPLRTRAMPTPSCEARRPGSVRKSKGWGPGFSMRYTVFAISNSTTIKKNRKQDADKRCLTTSAPSGAALSRLRDSSPVGVPPQLSPKGVVVPKARLQARFPGTWSDA